VEGKDGQARAALGTWRLSVEFNLICN